jgi:N4-(beta-N-acetylglucosaminyl)-L-asparaginase
VRGRVGDSPIVGSGCYVKNAIGGCAATGDGDIMMRFSPSYAAVLYMEMLHLSPREAAVKALQPIAEYFPTFSGGIVCLTANETYGAATYNMPFQISVMGDGLSEVQEIPVEEI